MAGRQRPRLPQRLPPLTARQEEVLALIAQGRTNFEIAEELGISLEGAKYHVREIMARLNAGSREEAVEVWRAGRTAPAWLPGASLRRAIALAGVRGVTTAAVAVVSVAGAVVVAAVFIGGSAGPPAAAPGETPETTVTTSTGVSTPATPGAQTTPLPATRTATPTLTPPAVGPYPLGTRTGDPTIDAVIAAVEARDADALFDLIHYLPAQCDNPNTGQPQPPGTFVCPNGEPDGTEIPVVRGEGSHGVLYPQGQPVVRIIVTDFLAADSVDQRVYGVVDAGPDLAHGERSIVFARGQALNVDGEGIIAFLSVRTGSPENRVANATSFLLPPLPSDPATFAEAVRAELAAAADNATLSEDQASGYGIFEAWEQGGFAIVPPAQVPVGRDQVSATAVKPPPGTGGDYTMAIYFAVADDAGKCAAGSIAIALPEGDPSAGFITFGTLLVPAGTLCTAEAALAAAFSG